jgi:LmbE family N-acetylglucosaminyl deacetylase
MNLIKIQRIFTVGAHLDDIEISCGGLIADATDKGVAIKMLVLSDSSYNRYDGQVARTKEEAYQEGSEAARILGAELEILDFPSKDIPFNSASIEAIDMRIAAFKPDLVLTHWTYDTHPSHLNTALATLAASRYHNNVLMYEPVMPSGRSYQGFRGQLYYRISELGVQKKREALMAHQSQYKKYGKEFWIDAVIARNIHRGYEIGAGHAECFEVVRLELNL